MADFVRLDRVSSAKKDRGLRSVAGAKMTGRKTLMLDVSRCAARYRFGDGLDDDASNWCPHRDTCARHQAFVSWDKEAGIQSYRGISVTMGRAECSDKIEVMQK